MSARPSFAPGAAEAVGADPEPPRFPPRTNQRTRSGNAAHRGRCALRWGSPVNRRPGGGGVEPRPYMQSKRRRRFSASPETAGGDGVLFLHRRRQSIFLIDAALRAAASLFSIVTQDGPRRIFQRSQPTAPKRRIGLPRPVGEAGGTHHLRWVLSAHIKAAFLWGATPVSLGKGQRNGVAYSPRRPEQFFAYCQGAVNIV